MKIRIYCLSHDGANVIPAGDEFHWIPDGNGWYTLDEADLYCTGKMHGVEGGIGWEHHFVVSVETKLD